MRRHLECKECEKLIPDFIAQKMNYKTLKRFCEHVWKCSDCHEELTIQFLVTEGMSRLEEGDAFDLNQELAKRMVEARRKLRRKEYLISVGNVLQLIVIVVVLCGVFWFIFR